MPYADDSCAEKLSRFERNVTGVGVSSPGSRMVMLINDFPFMHRTRKRGDYLFHVGDNLGFIYVLNAGFAKTCQSSADGQEQTIGLHLRGDILGLESVSSGSHRCDAVAQIGRAHV